MGIFKKITEGITGGLDRAQWEADKLVKVNKIRGEISALEKELAAVNEKLANQVLELHAEGRLQAPELEEILREVVSLQERLDDKQEELRATQAMKFEDAQRAQPEEAPAAPSTAPAATPKFCPNCGATLQEGARFCPQCGHKIGE